MAELLLESELDFVKAILSETELFKNAIAEPLLRMKYAVGEALKILLIARLNGQSLTDKAAMMLELDGSASGDPEKAKAAWKKKALHVGMQLGRIVM